VLMGLGLLFLVVSTAGIIRLPDFYARLHASGNSETLGLMLTILGFAVYEGFNLVTIKLLMIFLLVFIGNPIGTHIMSKAAIKSGYPVWTKKTVKKEDEE